MATEAYEYHDPAGQAEPLVGVGDPAPDVTVEDAAGQPVRLASFWQHRPVVLVFIRHLG
jgi:peroxiredoxin